MSNLRFHDPLIPPLTGWGEEPGEPDVRGERVLVCSPGAQGFIHSSSNPCKHQQSMILSLHEPCVWVMSYLRLCEDNLRRWGTFGGRVKTFTLGLGF